MIGFVSGAIEFVFLQQPGKGSALLSGEPGRFGNIPICPIQRRLEVLLFKLIDKTFFCLDQGLSEHF